MNAPFDPTLLMNEKFAVGQPVSRKEDPVLLRGEGRYTDDLNLPRPALRRHGAQPDGARRVCARSTPTAAREMPGVHVVITAADLDAAGIKNMPAAAGKHRDGTPTPRPPQRPLATDRVRYVGEPIAMVVAETIKHAKDAAEAVFVDIDPLPAVTTASAAAAPDAPQLHDDAPGNVCLDFHYGDSETGRRRLRARRACHETVACATTVSSCVRWSRARPSANTMPEADRLILRLGCQGVFGQRNLLSSILGVPVEKLRVLTGNVGGSFGMKSSAYPEYICLLYAARTLGRPVKWTDERSESFLSDSHGRDHEMTAELALDADGKFLALRVTGYGNLGAWLSNATTIPPTMNTVKNIIGVYATPLIAGVDEMHVHQHDAGRRLSRRRAARRQLLHGAAGRNRGARDGHRPGGTAPAQPHPAGADAVQGAVRHAVRQRRIPGRDGKGADRRDWDGYAARHRRSSHRAARCAAAASATIWK